MIQWGISRINIGLLDMTTNQDNDDLVKVANRIADNIFLVGEAVETVARFIKDAAKAGGD